jgi:hypothetical protein
MATALKPPIQGEPEHQADRDHCLAVGMAVAADDV